MKNTNNKNLVLLSKLIDFSAIVDGSVANFQKKLISNM